MPEVYALDWEGFLDFCHEADGITVLEGDREQTYLTIEDLDNTDPLLVAELFVVAHDSDVYVGGFNSERYDGVVTFYPGDGR